MRLTRSFKTKSLRFFALILLTTALPVSAFDSGSTGADGPFAPVSDLTIILPANGILNYSTFNIPAGVTVTIASNAANTPAFILVQGDAVIDGSIDISGVDGDSVSSNPAGGFAGGLPSTSGGAESGRGPGGGLGALLSDKGGNGGSYATVGSAGSNTRGNANGNPAPTYGSTSLQPLLGGSGGGASRGGGSTPGLRGGGGGGALLLAISGTLTLNGSILANGGDGGNASPPATTSRGGGGGSGGAVRLIASTLTGSGIVDINGGERGTSTSGSAGFGGIGRARLEADVFSFAGTVTPNIVSTSAPQPVFASNLPVLRISTIGGSAVPVNPQGENDVVLPTSIVNPVTVQFAAADIPLGSTIELTVTPANGVSETYTSTGLTGAVANSTATVDIELEAGASVLTAAVSFATASISNPIYARYTNGEKVARVEIQATMGAGSSIWITTESGRVIALPPRVVNL